MNSLDFLGDVERALIAYRGIVCARVDEAIDVFRAAAADGNEDAIRDALDAAVSVGCLDLSAHSLAILRASMLAGRRL